MLQDFVDRIEVLYVLSQLLRDEKADLPGSQSLAGWKRRETWPFHGTQWRELRDGRRESTAFTAAINYGPALKAMGWVTPHPQHRSILDHTPVVEPALDAFEARIAQHLHHPAFSQFGPLDIRRVDVRDWAEHWALEDPTEAEQTAAAELLQGSRAPGARRDGCALMLSAVEHAATAQADSVRRVMADVAAAPLWPDGVASAAAAWRRLQGRQLFRLSLEALLYWIQSQVESRPRTTAQLVNSFAGSNRLLDETVADLREGAAGLADANPTTLMDRINASLEEPSPDLPQRILEALTFCLVAAPRHHELFERPDRLPLSRARCEADARSRDTLRTFLEHVFETCVIAQHVYWSVGRGLADARVRGKMILRLRIVMEHGGWSTVPGATSTMPQPTQDRLATALTLAEECRLLPRSMQPAVP